MKGLRTAVSQPEGSFCGTARLRRRSMQHLRGLRWALIAILWIVTLALSYWGFARYYAARPTGNRPGFPCLLYLSLQVFVLESGWVEEPANWQVEVARLLGPAVAAYTALEGLILLFSKQLFLLRLRVFGGHIVVCGLGAEGLRIARALHEHGYRVVAVGEPAQAAARYHDPGLALLAADPLDYHTLVRVGVPRAKYVIAATGEDSANAAIAVRARALSTKRRGGALTCIVSVSDPDVCELLRETFFATPSVEGFRLEFSTQYERAARALLGTHPPVPPNREKANVPPHILLVGCGRFGEAVLAQAAWMWRETRCTPSDTKLLVTVVDREATTRCARVFAKSPQLGQAIELVPRDLDVTSADFQRGSLIASGQTPCSVDIAYVCLPGDALCLSAALALRRMCRHRQDRFPIVVRTTEGTGLAELMEQPPTQGFSFKDIYIFSFFQHACGPDTVLCGITELLAQAAHEHYLQEALATGEPMYSRAALRPWDELSEDLKESNREFAAHAAEQLARCGYVVVPLTDWDAAESFAFPPEDLERLACLEHDRWCNERRRAGWKYAPTRDERRRLHPALVPWDQLPEDVKEWDRKMIRALPRFLPRAGFQIVRSRPL